MPLVSREEALLSISSFSALFLSVCLFSFSLDLLHKGEQLLGVAAEDLRTWSHAEMKKLIEFLVPLDVRLRMYV